jgi:hypothetical protein
LDINNQTAVYRVNNLTTTDSADSTEWSFSFYTMKGYPFAAEQSSSMVFTAYDASDNWSTSGFKHNTNPRSKTFKAMSMKLDNFRITGIADYAWKSSFINADGSPTSLKLNGIGILDMPVFKNKKDNCIKLGYKVNFSLDTIGLNNAGDTILVNTRYYVVSQNGTQVYPADIFVENRMGRYEKLAESEYKNIALNIVLNAANRHPYLQDPARTSYNTWDFSFFLPPAAKVVRQGQSLNIYEDNSFKTKLLVVFDIKGIKAGGSTEYNYTAREVTWGTGNGSVYGSNKPIVLPDTGNKAGEVFWYDLVNTLLDDIELNRKW